MLFTLQQILWHLRTEAAKHSSTHTFVVKESWNDSGKKTSTQPTNLNKKANLQKGRYKTRQLYQYLHRFVQE